MFILFNEKTYRSPKLYTKEIETKLCLISQIVFESHSLPNWKLNSERELDMLEGQKVEELDSWRAR